jgi:hypothetical protein
MVTSRGDHFFMRSFKILFLALNLNLSLIASEGLSSLSDEQIAFSNAIFRLLDENYYRSEIAILLPNQESITISYKQFKKALIFARESRDIEKTETALLETFAKKKQALIAKVDHPKLFIFSEKTGERLIKFECSQIKIGKIKLGIFEIPSNKILFDSPLITYY